MRALLIRDIRLAFRAGGGFGLSLAFFLMVAVIVPLGVGPAPATLALIAAGVLWVGALLAALLSRDRIFALDYEDGSLDLLATSPLPLGGVVAMKALAHWLTTGLPLVAAAPVLGIAGINVLAVAERQKGPFVAIAAEDDVAAAPAVAAVGAAFIGLSGVAEMDAARAAVAGAEQYFYVIYE